MDKNNIAIKIEGSSRSGKSTILVLLAQYLATIGYDVTVPPNLVGLSVNEDLLNKNTSESTNISFEEVQTKEIPKWLQRVKEVYDLTKQTVDEDEGNMYFITVVAETYQRAHELSSLIKNHVHDQNIVMYSRMVVPSKIRGYYNRMVVYDGYISFDYHGPDIRHILSVSLIHVANKTNVSANNLIIDLGDYT